MELFLIPLFIVLAIAIGVFGWLAEKKRREAFQTLALRLGMHYIPKDHSISARYQFLDQLRQGSNRYAKNILTGEYRGHPMTAFDYHYETHSTDSKGRRQTHHHWFSFFILEQTKGFPELRIYPETWLSKIGQALGYDDIDFESAEFSRAFTVRSDDKKFAYDIVNQRMMEYLLNHRDLTIEIQAQCVSLGFTTRLKPEQIEARMSQLVDIRAMFPEYLYRD